MAFRRSMAVRRNIWLVVDARLMRCGLRLACCGGRGRTSWGGRLLAEDGDGGGYDGCLNVAIVMGILRVSGFNKYPLKDLSGLCFTRIGASLLHGPEPYRLQRGWGKMGSKLEYWFLLTKIAAVILDVMIEDGFSVVIPALDDSWWFLWHVGGGKFFCLPSETCQFSKVQFPIEFWFWIFQFTKSPS